MELTQLKYFAEVAESLHVTKSAEKLHVAQPALSQAIKRLEDDIGVKLFKNRGRNVVLTEYGEYLKREVAPILEKLEVLPQELRRMAKTDPETIKLNVSAASALVTEAIIAYKRQNEVNFRVFRGEGIGDVTISSSAKGAGDWSLSEKIYIAAPRGKGYPDKIALWELSEEDFICLADSPFRDICDKFCRQCGFKPRIAYESDNPTSVRNMIAANMGVGFWPEFTWGKVDEEHVKLSEISGRFERELTISRDLSSDSPHTEKFYEFLIEYFKKRKEEIRNGV